MSKKSKNRDLGRNDQPQAVDEPQVNTSALEASQAFVESAEVLNKGAGSTLEDAFAPDQTVRSAPPSAVGASGSPGASDAATAAAEHSPEGTTPREAMPQEATPQGTTPRVGTSDSGEAILHSTRALEDDPAMKAAQVLALDNAAEQAEREALEEAAEAEELRKTTTENLKMPPPKPVDNPEDLKTAGQVLRYHRQRMGLSIKQVADQLKARATTIADIEADRLNAPSVVKMVSRQVSSYAILLNLDAEEVVRLYRQNIKENVTIEHVEVRPKSDGRMNRIWLLVVLMILVATAGYFVFGGENKDDAPKSGALKDPALTTAHDTATALVTSDSKLTVGEPVVIETEPNANAPEVMVVDENTARATAQQYALQQQNAAAAAAQAAQAPVEQPDALLLPEGVAHDDLKPQAPESRSTAASLPVEVVVAEPTVATVDTSPGANLPEDQAVLEPARPASAARVAPEPESKLAPAPEAEPVAAPEVKAPQLAAQLKDISAQVKVVGRDGLASLNRAELKVTAPVALAVTDGLGKTVKSGTFNSGEVVKITAIPPIVVKLSDTSAVKISYMGGTIAMPEAKQVRFELPQR